MQLAEFKAKKAAALAQRQAAAGANVAQSVASFASRQSSNASDVLATHRLSESSAQHVPLQASQVPAKSVLGDSSTAALPNGHHPSSSPTKSPNISSGENEQLRAQVQLLTANQTSVQNELAEVKRQLLSRTAEVNKVTNERDAALSDKFVSEQHAREAQEKAQESTAAQQAAESNAATLQIECERLKQDLGSLNGDLQQAKRIADEGAAVQQQSMQDQRVISELREQLQARTDELSSAVAEEGKRVTEGAEKASQLALELQTVQDAQQRLQVELVQAKDEHQASVDAMQQAFDAEKTSLQHEVQNLQQSAKQQQQIAQVHTTGRSASHCMVVMHPVTSCICMHSEPLQADLQQIDCFYFPTGSRG